MNMPSCLYEIVRFLCSRLPVDPDLIGGRDDGFEAGGGILIAMV